MHIRQLPLLLLVLALSGCARPATPSATLAPTPPSETNTPIAKPEPTATAKPEPTATAKPEPTATAIPEPTQALSQGLKTATCPFEIPDGINVQCGFLSVPENRAQSDSPMIELAVAIFKSKQANAAKPDPIVYLEGGPGGNALQQVPLSFKDRFEPFLADRDFIMFDQRGTGYSKPSLACSEYTQLGYDTLDQNLSLAEGNKRANAALLACHDRLKAQGIDFTAYNSIASAADLNDLRKALGYKEWNLYGISYGTRLALTTMREQPEGIRSVILDSTVALQSSETRTAADANHALETLFTGCASDPACAKAYPKLRDTFYKLVDTLDKQPVTGDASDPFSGKKYKVLINGESLISIVFQGLYSSNIIPLLPRAITAAASGTDYSLFLRLGLSTALENEYVSVGMLYTVRCNEEIPFDTPAALQKSGNDYPQLKGVFDTSSYIPICGAWEAGSAPATENQPVASDIPTLVLSGQYDPVTPADEGQAAAKTLSQSFFFLYPGLGHGVSIDDPCPRGMTEAFLEDPTTKPDDSCIAKMSPPVFAGTEPGITLVPLKSNDFGFSSVVPQGWVEISTGVYARSRDSNQAILQLALPGDEAAVLDRVKQALKLEGDVASTGKHKGKSLTWTLYSFTLQGQPVDVALSPGTGRTYVVILISDKLDQATLSESLFIPALDAFKLVP